NSSCCADTHSRVNTLVATAAHIRRAGRRPAGGSTIGRRELCVLGTGCGKAATGGGLSQLSYRNHLHTASGTARGATDQPYRVTGEFGGLRPFDNYPLPVRIHDEIVAVLEKKAARDVVGAGCGSLRHEAEGAAREQTC